MFNNEKYMSMTVLKPKYIGGETYWGPASESDGSTYLLRSLNNEESDMTLTWQFDSVTQATVTVDSCTVNCLWQPGQTVTLQKFFGDMEEAIKECPLDTGGLKEVFDQVATSATINDPPSCDCSNYPLTVAQFKSIYASVKDLLGTTYACRYNRDGQYFERKFLFFLFSDKTMGVENFVIQSIWWDDMHDGPQTCGFYYMLSGGEIWCGLY